MVEQLGSANDRNFRTGVVLLVLVGVAAATLAVASLGGGSGDPTAEAVTSEPAAAVETSEPSIARRSEKTSPQRTCSLNADDLEELTGFEEVVESIDCVYWVGYIRPDENADAQCTQVLGYARSLDPDVARVKIKDRSGETHADCR